MHRYRAHVIAALSGAMALSPLAVPAASAHSPRTEAVRTAFTGAAPSICVAGDGDPAGKGTADRDDRVHPPKPGKPPVPPPAPAPAPVPVPPPAPTIPNGPDITLTPNRDTSTPGSDPAGGGPSRDGGSAGGADNGGSGTGDRTGGGASGGGTSGCRGSAGDTGSTSGGGTGASAGARNGGGGGSRDAGGGESRNGPSGGARSDSGGGRSVGENGSRGAVGTSEGSSAGPESGQHSGHPARGGTPADQDWLGRTTEPTAPWFSLDRAREIVTTPLGMLAVAIASLVAWRVHRNRRAKQQQKKS